MEFVAVQGADGFHIAVFAQCGDEPGSTLAALDFLLIGRGEKSMIETRDDQFFESGSALRRHDFGAMQDFIRKVDGSFHGLYLRMYGYIVKVSLIARRDNFQINRKSQTWPDAPDELSKKTLTLSMCFICVHPVHLTN